MAGDAQLGQVHVREVRLPDALDLHTHTKQAGGRRSSMHRKVSPTVVCLGFHRQSSSQIQDTRTTCGRDRPESPSDGIPPGCTLVPFIPGPRSCRSLEATLADLNVGWVHYQMTHPQQIPECRRATLFLGEKAHAPKRAGLWPIRRASWETFPHQAQKLTLKEPSFHARLPDARSGTLFKWHKTASQLIRYRGHGQVAAGDPM